MVAMPRSLAPAPASLTPDRVAIAAVVAITCAGVPAVIASIRDLKQMLHDGPAGPVAIAVIASTLAVLVAARALTRRTALSARVTCVAGSAAAGILTVLLSYVTVVLIGAGERIRYREEVPLLVLGSFIMGAPLGGAFGILFAPVIVTAKEVELLPSHDGLDRVLAAAGGTWIAAGAAGALVPGNTPALYVGLAVVGAGLAVVGVARVLLRARHLARVRAAGAPGWSIVPPTGSEADRALAPFVRGETRATGVLVMVGASDPYRGVRGEVRVARAPLDGEPEVRPASALVAGALDEITSALLSVPVGLAGIGAVGLAIGMFVLMVSAATR